MSPNKCFLGTSFTDAPIKFADVDKSRLYVPCTEFTLLDIKSDHTPCLRKHKVSSVLITRMYAHKKESAPTFGVKLLVSLTLLVISFCLVNCVPKPVPVEIEEKPISLTKAAAAVQITSAVSPLVADRTFSQVFPEFNLASLIPPSTSTDKLAARKVGTGIATKYEILLPKDKKITDYVNAIKRDLGTVTKDESSIKSALEDIFKQSAFDLGIKLNYLRSVEIVINLPQLEQLIYNNFELKADLMTKLSAPKSATVPPLKTGLFASVFPPSGPVFDAKVYLPAGPTGTYFSSTFVSACVKKVNDAATRYTKPVTFGDADTAASLLLKQIFSDLSDQNNPKATLCSWSKILDELTTWSYEKNNTISNIYGGTKFTEGHFEIGRKFSSFEDLPKIYSMFYADFGSFNKYSGASNDGTIVSYLSNCSGLANYTSFSFQEAVPYLIKATLDNFDSTKRPSAGNAPTDVDSNHVMVQGDIAALMAEIDTAIGVFKFPEFTVADFPPFPAGGCPFADGATANDLSCAAFPSFQGVSAKFEQYAKFVAELKSGTASVIDYTKPYSDIKNAYFDELWKPANLTAFKEYFRDLISKSSIGQMAAGNSNIETEIAKSINELSSSKIWSANKPGTASSNVSGGNAKPDGANGDANTNYGSPEGKSKESSGSWLILWIILAVVAVAGLFGGGYLLYSRLQSKNRFLK